MAEAVLRHYAGKYFDVVSAGLDPHPIHPLALKTLERANISTQGLIPKSVSQFLGKVEIDTAIIVCAKAQESCPRIYPFAREVLYWPFDDPAAATGSQEQQADVFQRVFNEIDQQVATWLTAENVPFER
jgi:arsenate reductase